MIQPKHNPVCPAILIMIWICACAGAGDTVSISSYGKNYLTLMRFSDYECERLGFSQSSFMSDSTRFRIALAWTLSDRFSLRGAYDVILLMQDSALFENNIFLPGLDTGRVEDFRIGNITPLLLPPHSEDIRSTALCQNADRFFLTADCGFGDIYAGRQAIAWGSGRIINPTDVIQPFSFNTLDTEERIGVDAVRIRIPTGALSEVDTGYVAGKDFKKNSSAFFIRTKNPVASHDVSLLCVGFREHLLLGCDVAGSLGGAGFWIEQAWVLTDMFHRSTRNSADDYYRISFGSDYTFTEKTYTFIDIHYNQPGAGNPAQYDTIRDTIPYTEGSVYLLGEWYCAPGLTYQITPLITFAGYSLWNVRDDSIYLMPSVEYNAAKDVYLSCGAYAGFGSSSAQELRSEFGTYTDIYFASVKIYF